MRKNRKVAKKFGMQWDRVSLIAASLSVFFLLIFSFWLGKTLYDLRLRAAGTGWVDNDRSVLKAAPWFTLHGYSDCPSEAGGFWPTSRADCFFGEPAGGPTAQDQVIEPAPGPSAQDQSIAPEPTGLYYKHLLPTDFIKTLPTLVLNINFTGITKQSLENTLLQAVQSNPTAYANISVDSLDVGLEGGVAGTRVRSLTLYVHPQFERPISGAIGVLQRAQNLYKPFIEGATGATISDADLTELYTAAMNRCGAHSLNNDQSGLGVFKTVGDYIVAVQLWNGNESSLIGGDCNIHVVAIASATVSPPPPGVITPTFACLGPCVPTNPPLPTTTIRPLPSVTLTRTPTPNIEPTITPEITTTVTSTPGPGGKPGSSNFLQLLLALIQLFLAFLAGLFGGK